MTLKELRKWRDLISIIIAACTSKGLDVDVRIETTSIPSKPYLVIFLNTSVEAKQSTTKQH